MNVNHKAQVMYLSAFSE